MSIHERFSALIGAFAEDCEFTAKKIERDQCQAQIFGRFFHISLDAEREEAMFATPVYLTDRQASLIHFDIISDFNCCRLFDGGERLAVDPVTGALYLSTSTTLAWLESGSRALFIEKFIDRCAQCTRWYADEIFERDIESKRTPFTEAATVADMAAVVRRSGG